eukprot:scaffold336267_cov50-Prasinocladus_malaysianus.AAC.1
MRVGLTDYFGVAIGSSIIAMILWLAVRVFCDKVLGFKPKPVDWAKLKATKHNDDSDDSDDMSE